MKLFTLSALAVSMTALVACGGSGTVTTTLSGERAAAPGGAPAFASAAKNDPAGQVGADAPITEAVTAIKLQIEKIAAHRAEEGSGNEAEGSETDGDSGWEVLSGAKEIDLVAAASSTDATEAILGTSDMTAGKYTQIRLYLKDTGNVIVVNGAEQPLTVPSGALKLVGTATIEDGKSYRLEIKLDLDKSLVVNNQGYKLRPTVKYSLTAN